MVEYCWQILGDIVIKVNKFADGMSCIPEHVKSPFINQIISVFFIDYWLFDGPIYLHKNVPSFLELGKKTTS